MSKPLWFVLAGAILCCVAIFLAVRSWIIVGERIAAEGEVLRVESRMVKTDSGLGWDPKYTAKHAGRINYFPFVRFRTQRGDTIQATAGSTGAKPIYERGQQVSVLYDPNEPERVRIYSFGTFWATPVVLGAIGFVLFVLGLALESVRGSETNQESPKVPTSVDRKEHPWSSP